MKLEAETERSKRFYNLLSEIIVFIKFAEHCCSFVGIKTNMPGLEFLKEMGRSREIGMFFDTFTADFGVIERKFLAKKLTRVRELV